MVWLSRIEQLKFAAAVVVVCTLETPARADELAQNLGPVGPAGRFSPQSAVSAS